MEHGQGPHQGGVPHRFGGGEDVGLGQEPCKPILAPHVGAALDAELVELDPLGAHAVDDQPGQHLTQYPLALGHPLGGHGVPRLRQLPLDQLRDLGDDEQLHLLAPQDAPHPEGPLGVVPEGHVLPERQRRTRVGGVRDVHPRGVHLVVECEPPLQGHAALLQPHHTPRRADQHHLPAQLVEEDHPLHPGQPVSRQQVLRDLQVAEPGHEGPRVDEGVERGIGVRDLVQKGRDGPAWAQLHVRHDCGALQRVHHQPVGPLLVPAPPQLPGEQVGGCAAETQPPLEQHVAPHLLP
mmetsp:Transcript_70148/g.123666  ORF Transcript_70148/g.123666 Transcript_70148/m.123666 type:complete len:294 (-) Transcript_70148:9888-10769(-)